ncbi:phosphate ABC transporter substrate-binding protein PstS family protein [Nesterenkonia sp. DZ6]|uniref:phosphate ABC transporter substrate-binding protein PstS family protein n=1 Tax=Nesterenkonia sp. DZ6 TaxID=2901229 RepID=UPI001F4C6F6F|nr:phosphate ABC transporter substrate-binding protein PstS family protein [Nesterenkonia sp. DZ6]MCH8561042.1 phosphate ABC transporter substrate-binding protein PstS family protein [Nesterenkonia sp. DZ6]
MRTFGRSTAILSIATLALVGCGDGGEEGEAETGTEEGGNGASGQVVIDGSSTVAPFGEAAAETFMQENPDVQVTVGTSGTGGGFESFCRGETDISEASRSISDEEIALCDEAGISYEELGVANDALSVIVNEENDFLECVSVDELSEIWNQDSEATNWSDIDPSYPDEAIQLYGPGTDSGTFDFFTEEINGEEGNIRSDYNDIGEDDFAAITGTSGNEFAMAFVPLSYTVEAEAEPIRTLEIENEEGDCVEPAFETVQDGSYNPLGRQLFMYPSDVALERTEVQEFLAFTIENNEALAESANFIGLTEEQAAEAQEKVDELTGN